MRSVHGLLSTCSTICNERDQPCKRNAYLRNHTRTGATSQQNVLRDVIRLFIGFERGAHGCSCLCLLQAGLLAVVGLRSDVVIDGNNNRTARILNNGKIFI